MKAMICEMCGSNDLVKQSGLFICQNCGTKYSVEDAKKLMVQIDNSEELNNLKTLARRAYREEDYANAAKLYDQVLLKEPSNIEASFTTVCCRAYSCKISEIPDTIKTVGNRTRTTLHLIKDTIDSDSQHAVCEGIIEAYCKIQRTLEKAAIASYKKKSPNGDLRLLNSGHEAYKAADFMIADELVKCFGFKDLAEKVYRSYMSSFNSSSSQYTEAANRIKSLYGPIESGQDETNKRITSQQACYVATAVYGSYDCPEVWTLRRYRDYSLAETLSGRLFIRTYYGISPTLVKWFGHEPWFRNLWKPILDKTVKRLNGEGISDTPYEDRIW